MRKPRSWCRGWYDHNWKTGYRLPELHWWWFPHLLQGSHTLNPVPLQIIMFMLLLALPPYLLKQVMDFFCDNAAIIKLFSFLIIEPKPTTISLTNTAPSKLILYQPIGGVAIWLALQQEEPTADLDEFFETPSHFREPLNWSYSLELSFHSSILCFYETRAVR